MKFNKKRFPLFAIANFISLCVALYGKQYIYENQILLGLTFCFLGGTLFIASYVYLAH